MEARRSLFNGLCVFVLSSGVALAAPVPLSSYLLDFNQLSSKVVTGPGGASDRVDLSYQQAVVSTSSSNELTPEVYGFADLTTAEAGATTRSLNSGNDLDALSSKATLYDTVTFASSATVSYNFNVSGSLSSTDTQVNNILTAIGAVGILDITGQAQWIFGLDGTSVPLGSELFTRTVESTMESTSILGANRALISRIDNNFPSDGNDYAVNIDVSGSLDVEAGKTYGLVLSMSTIASGARINAADFSNTAMFRFTDLGGTTYTSGSGVLLTAVPLPGAFWLMLTALAGLRVFGVKARREN